MSIDTTDALNALKAEAEVKPDNAEQVESSTTETGQESTDNVSQDVKTDDVPFNEHPRFKELVEEKNRYKAEIEQTKARLEELEKSTQKKPEAEATLDLDFEDMSPDLRKYAEKITAQAKKGAYDEVMSEFRRAYETAATEKQKQSEEIAKISESFGGTIPEDFIKFVENKSKVYKNVNLQELYEDFKSTQVEQPDRVATSTATSSNATTEPGVNMAGDLQTIAKQLASKFIK